MDYDVKTKVDEYENFVLKRHGLDVMAEQDKEKAGNALKVQLEANYPENGTSRGEAPKPDYQYDMGALKYDFTLHVPTRLKKDNSRLPDLPICGGNYSDWDIGQNLPFPPELVEDLTGRDLVFLKRTFSLTGPKKYYAWGEVYDNINRQFEDKREDAERIVEWLMPTWQKRVEPTNPIDSLLSAAYSNHLPMNIRVAPVFLASAQACLSHREIPSSIAGLQRIQKDTLPDLEKRALRFFQALEVFERTLNMDEDKEDSFSLEANIGNWMKRIRLGVNLPQVLNSNSANKLLQTRVKEAVKAGEWQINITGELKLGDILTLLKFGVENELATLTQYLELFRDKVYSPVVPGNSHDGSLPPVIYHIVDSLADFIKPPDRKNRDIKSVIDLFEEWGIKTNDRSVRQARKAREKSVKS